MRIHNTLLKETKLMRMLLIGIFAVCLFPSVALAEVKTSDGLFVNPSVKSEVKQTKKKVALKRCTEKVCRVGVTSWCCRKNQSCNYDTYSCD